MVVFEWFCVEMEGCQLCLGSLLGIFHLYFRHLGECESF